MKQQQSKGISKVENYEKVNGEAFSKNNKFSSEIKAESDNKEKQTGKKGF
ncbi:hypothetical protein [Mammaliicoccus vitulinus]|nr:hypothetical protein [Mammaliicoccus vitulinus]